MARKLKIMENEKHPLDDLKNDEITKKRDRKSVVQGKSVDLGGRRIIKKIFFKQKTAYEMQSGDWSSDVCSSDLELEYGEKTENHGK